MPFDLIKPETPLIDAMRGAARWHSQVSDFGFVDMVDVMPRLIPEGQTVDQAIVQAARVSYGAGTKSISDDRGLIRYLLRNRHTTPLEMVELKFHCAMPIFVARQWIRHRTANVNEMSGRYSILPNRFFRPPLDDIRKQSKTNRQGRDEPVDDLTAREFLAWLDKADETYQEYEKFVEKGIAREMARVNLPVSIFTEWYWKIDLHNLFHFLSLRLDAHAQKEIRDYADPMFEMLRELVPVASEAFVDYRLESISLSRLEVEAIARTFVNGYPNFYELETGFYALETSNKRETEEWEKKRKMLFGV